MSTKIFSVDSTKVQMIVGMGIKWNMPEVDVLSAVKTEFLGFDTVKMFDDTEKDIAALTYDDLLDTKNAADRLIVKYTQSPEYVAYRAAWDALNVSRETLVKSIPDTSGIGVRSMPDPDLFVEHPGGGEKLAYNYVIGAVYNNVKYSDYGVRVDAFVPVKNKDGSEKVDAKGNPVLFVSSCTILKRGTDGKYTEVARKRAFASLSKAVYWIQKRVGLSPNAGDNADGDPSVSGVNAPQWLKAPLHT
jgi:hypothetical protein